MSAPALTLRGASGPAVWSLFALCLAGSLALVARYGVDLPRSDEWRDALVLLEGRPLTWEWLWAPHEVHRAPLSRLIRYVLYDVAGDFRAALCFSVAVMAAASAVMIRTAARLRGRSAWSDAFFPLALLGPGHYANFLWGFQVAFTLSSALFVMAVAVAAGMEAAPTRRQLTLLAALCSLQSLTGANGLALSLPLLAWVIWTALRLPASDGAGRLAPLATSAIALAVFVAYPIGLRARHGPAAPAEALGTMLQYLSTALTPAAVWWKARAALVAGLFAGTALILQRTLRGSPAAKARAAALLACLAACALLAFVVGIGRGDLGAMSGLEPRYTTLAAPLLCIAFLAFTLHGPGRSRHAVPATLALLVIPATMVNAVMAAGYGEIRRQQVAALEADAHRGLPPAAIAARNGTAIYQYAQGAPFYVERLIERRAWPFERYALDPEIRVDVTDRSAVAEEPVPLRDLDLSEDGAFVATGPEPWLLVPLGGPREAAGVEIVFEVEAPPGRLGRLEVRWGIAGEAGTDFPWWIRRAAFALDDQEGERRLVVWIYDRIDRIRLDLDRTPTRFRIRSITLMELAPGWLPVREGLNP